MDDFDIDKLNELINGTKQEPATAQQEKPKEKSRTEELLEQLVKLNMERAKPQEPIPPPAPSKRKTVARKPRAPKKKTYNEDEVERIAEERFNQKLESFLSQMEQEPAYPVDYSRRVHFDEGPVSGPVSGPLEREQVPPLIPSLPPQQPRKYPTAESLGFTSRYEDMAPQHPSVYEMSQNIAPRSSANPNGGKKWTAYDMAKKLGYR